MCTGCIPVVQYHLYRLCLHIVQHHKYRLCIHFVQHHVYRLCLHIVQHHNYRLCIHIVQHHVYRLVTLLGEGLNPGLCVGPVVILGPQLYKGIVVTVLTEVECVAEILYIFWQYAQPSSCGQCIFLTTS